MADMQLKEREKKEEKEKKNKKKKKESGKERKIKETKRMEKKEKMSSTLCARKLFLFTNNMLEKELFDVCIPGESVLQNLARAIFTNPE